MHVDDVPGDRAAGCGGLMVPVALIHRSGKGWQLAHSCVMCGVRRTNRIAVDTEQPDDIDRLAELL